jgi:DNA-binding Lrp family transcriptional regulator
MKVFVEISVARGKVGKTLHELRRMKEIRAVSVVTGHCDILSTAEVNSIEDLSRLITDEVQSLQGILRTETLVCLSTD